MKTATTLHALVGRQIRRSVTIPLAILALTTFGLVLRHALLESAGQARVNALRGAIAIDQSTAAFEAHWKVVLLAGLRESDFESFLQVVESIDSTTCLVSVWQGDSLRFSHPRHDEASHPPRTASNWTGVERDPRCDEPVVRHTVPLDSNRTVVLSFRLSQLSRILLEPQKRLGNHLSLVDGRGVYVADFRSELMDQGEVDPLSGVLASLPPNPSGIRIEGGRLLGYSAQSLRGPPWILIARQDTLRTVQGLLPLLGLMVFFLAVSVVVGSRIRRKAVGRILAPLEGLRRSLGALEDGRFEKRFEPSGLLEIDNLTETFQRMAETIESREATRRKELERAIEGLESFSYTVSHDLRSPLRAIDGYARILKEDEAERLSPEATRILDRIIAAAHRMHLLIDDLLRLARTKRTSLVVEAFDMDALAREVAAEEASRAPEHPVRWEILPLGSAVGDPGLLRQVWSNLFSNAIKYSSTREASEIRVWRTDSPGSTTWSVSDNGVGFDPQHAAKLFGTFQRLHADKEFEGTGIGLALVRSIVEMHGGRVSGDATPEGGATFRFELPLPTSRPKGNLRSGDGSEEAR